MPHYSWHPFGKANAKFISQLVYLAPDHVLPARMAFAAWGLAFLYAFLRRDRLLELMAFWVVITPLPLDFIIPIRGDVSLILVLFGCAMIFAKLTSDLIKLVSKSSIVTGPRSGVGAAIGAIIGGTPTGHASAAVIGAAVGAAAVRLHSSRRKIRDTLDNRATAV